MARQAKKFYTKASDSTAPSWQHLTIKFKVWLSCGVLALHVSEHQYFCYEHNDFFPLAWAFSGMVAAISIGAIVHVWLCVFSFKQRLKYHGISWWGWNPLPNATGYPIWGCFKKSKPCKCGMHLSTACQPSSNSSNCSFSILTLPSMLLLARGWTNGA